MSGWVEGRPPDLDYRFSLWRRAVLLVILAAVLTFWITLGLTVGYLFVGFGKILSIPNRRAKGTVLALSRVTENQ